MGDHYYLFVHMYVTIIKKRRSQILDSLEVHGRIIKKGTEWREIIYFNRIKNIASAFLLEYVLMVYDFNKLYL